jgi:hypothetical protein
MSLVYVNDVHDFKKQRRGEKLEKQPMYQKINIGQPFT